MMRRRDRWMLSLTLLIAVGCGVPEQAVESAPWASENDAPGPMHTGADLEVPEIEIPTATCDVAPMTDDLPRDTPVKDSQVTLVERIDAEGCPYERERHAYEDGREVLYFMEYLDPDRFYAYVEPTDHSIAFVYGENGALLEERRSPSPEEPAEEMTEYAYDGQDRTILERRSKRNEVGGFDEYERKTWEFGDQPASTYFSYLRHGELLSGYEKTFTDSGELLTEYVVEADDDRWLRHEWERDANDRPLVHRVYDRNGVLQSESTWTHRLDGTSEKYRVRHDMGWVEVRRYDTSGHPIYYSQDSTGDGDPDFVREQEFEGDQMVFERVRYAFDADGEAQTEKEKRWTLDEKGRVVEINSRRYHEPDVNIEPRRQRRTIEYFADGGRLVENETRHLDTGELMRATHTEFDAHGERIWMHEFHRHQGWSTETSWMRTYDDEGRPLLIARDSTADGVADEVIRYEYDAFGNLLEKHTDSNADGTPNHRIVKRYGTPSLW